ncbi:MAG: hypothetical protein KKA42_12675 [candidate division Zixibacteria bacterium]|nr:hypothetical protein [candidate division Zixibacteria bacterium]
MPTCPDCSEGLIDSLSEVYAFAAVLPDDGWVGVCNLSSEIMTNLVKGALDTNNIPSVIAPAAFRELGRNESRPTSARTARTVMVPKEFQNEASLILESMLGDGFAEHGAM